MVVWLSRKRVPRRASLAGFSAFRRTGKGRVPLLPLPVLRKADPCPAQGGSGKRAMLEEGSPWID
jgi:hypothetical protein